MTVRPQILALARSGALERAWSLLEHSGLAAADTDPGALTLKARLIKDRATHAEGTARARLFGESGALYERAAMLAPATYPLINAASLALLAGQPGHARTLAQNVLDFLEDHPDEPETPYWRGATRAEALLLLGRVPEARTVLHDAFALASRAWEDHAATLRQFALVCGELGEDCAWIDQIRPPSSISYSGIMGVGPHQQERRSEIARWLEQENVGFGYGALAAGADIWIANLLVERGAELHVVLPCRVDAFRKYSVAAVGAEWAPQFDRLIDQATSFDQLDLLAEPTIAAVALADDVATGLAIGNARRLQSRVLTLRVAPFSEGEAGHQTPGTLPMRRIDVCRGDGQGGMVLPEGAPHVHVMAISGGMGISRYTDSVGLLHAVREAKARGEAVAVDVKLDCADDDDSLLDALLEVAQPGQALATMAAAYAMLGGAPHARVEPMGDIRTSRRRFTFFSIG